VRDILRLKGLVQQGLWFIDFGSLFVLELEHSKRNDVTVSDTV
jgi:hypothetical protein